MNKTERITTRFTKNEAEILSEMVQYLSSVSKADFTISSFIRIVLTPYLELWEQADLGDVGALLKLELKLLEIYYGREKK